MYQEREQSNQELLKLEQQGFPVILVFEDHFKIKAIDHWEFRTFKYSEVTRLIHYNPNDKWWRKIYTSLSFTARYFSEDDPHILKVVKNNGGDWKYQTAPGHNSDFSALIEFLNAKCGKEH